MNTTINIVAPHDPAEGNQSSTRVAAVLDIFTKRRLGFIGSPHPTDEAYQLTITCDASAWPSIQDAIVEVAPDR